MQKVKSGAGTTPSGIEIEMVYQTRESLRYSGLRVLCFPAVLESAFNEYYFSNTLKHVRVALLTGLFLYALFGLVDLQLLPADRNHMWFIRYAVVCPTVAAGLAFTFRYDLRRFMQPVLWLVMLTGSLGIVGMVYFDPMPARNYYYSGILLLVMGAFTFVSLRFYYAISWAVATVLAYEAVAIYATRSSADSIVQNTFSIVSTIIIGAFSNCLMDSYLRRDFLNSLILEHENRQLQEASRELHQLSISDPLTGIGNRRHFETVLDQEWKRAMRSQIPLSLVLFDLDSFKRYNDRYGHQAGDECLKRVADKLRDTAKRPGDTAARYGGEEFVLLLSGTELAQAAAVAEACRAEIEALNIPHQDSLVSGVVTVSAGVACVVPESGLSSRELIEAADKALYRAKSQGRNRVGQGEVPGLHQPADETRRLRSQG